ATRYPVTSPLRPAHAAPTSSPPRAPRATAPMPSILAFQRLLPSEAPAGVRAVRDGEQQPGHPPGEADAEACPRGRRVVDCERVARIADCWENEGVDAEGGAREHAGEVGRRGEEARRPGLVRESPAHAEESGRGDRREDDPPRVVRHVDLYLRLHDPGEDGDE